MSDMKCPFCQQELEIDDLDVQLLGCENQNCKHSIHYDTVGSKELWQELIRTRKALDGAKKALNDIQFTDDGNRIVDIRSFAHHALDQITALEQKEHFADTSKKIEQKDK